MAPRKRQRRNLKTINEEEGPNTLIAKLSSNDFVLEFTSIVFTNIIPEYEVMEDKVEELADVYDEKILDYYEAAQRMLKAQRDDLKDAVFQEGNEIKIPKTPKRGKNVSKIDKMHDTIENRKDRMKKNLFVNSNLSHNATGASGRGVFVINKASGTIGLHKNVGNIPTTSPCILTTPNRNGDTTDRAVLIARQGSSLLRADMKKKDLLKEKAEKAKKEREERARQVVERKRLKEQEREEMLREKKEKEERIKEFKGQMIKPGMPNGQCFKTPTFTVPHSEISSKDIISRTSTKPMEVIETNATMEMTIVDESCEKSELVYETPAATRKRKSASSREGDSFSSPSRKNQRACYPENITPEVTFNCYQAETLCSKPLENNPIMEFEKKMKSVEVTDIFASVLLDSTNLNTSVTRNFEYEMTPDKVPLPSTVDDYNIADLSEGDGTDDEDCPRKVIPKWAHMECLRPALKEQHKKFGSRPLREISNIFGKVHQFEVASIFKGKKYVRSSSAIWSSPPNNSKYGKAIYYQLNESIVDSSFFND
uniref:INCENP_ARK-bind domain-containing protein n=1 Tax=Strongyloides venezuelensis TaxID=75913 RepID=A0A0K0F5C2_STRVS